VVTDREDEQWRQENIEEARTVPWSEATLPDVFDLDDPASDHTHCIVCWKALNRKLFAKAYESSIGWLCADCYEEHIKGKQGPYK